MSGPKPSPQVSAAMAAATVVLKGKAGASFASKCAQIFAAFSPPIVAGSYSSVSNARRAGGPNSPLAGSQSEHFIPNSNFMEGPGRSGPTIDGCSGYSEAEGFTYNVFDDQSAGTEHKWLTDVEREFAQQLEGAGENATVGDWLDHMESSTAEMLDADLTRNPGGTSRSRITGASKLTPKQRKNLAAAAARCLRVMAEQQLASQGIGANQPLRNGQAGGAPPPASSSPPARPRGRPRG